VGGGGAVCRGGYQPLQVTGFSVDLQTQVLDAEQGGLDCVTVYVDFNFDCCVVCAVVVAGHVVGR
jgi:hypothetical protein